MNFKNLLLKNQCFVENEQPDRNDEESIYFEMGPVGVIRIDIFFKGIQTIRKKECFSKCKITS